MERAFNLLRKKLGYENSVYEILRPHIDSGRVLSIGSGQGKIERLLKRNLGVDIQGVEVTKYREQGIRTRLFDGKSLPFRDKSFDTTLFIYMLHHTENIEELISEAKRVTRKSIIILDHTYTNSFSRLMLKAYDYFANVPYRMPVPFNFLKIREWKTLFEKLNLGIEGASIPTALNVFFKLDVKG